MTTMFMTSLGDGYSSSEDEKIQFVDEEEKSQQQNDDDFFMSIPKSSQEEEENIGGDEHERNTLEESIEEDHEPTMEYTNITPSNIIQKEDESTIMQHSLVPSIIYITPSHTPFELTKSNIQVPIDTIHPSWKNSITNRSIEQQKLEQFKLKYNGKAKSKKLHTPIPEVDFENMSKIVDTIAPQKVDDSHKNKKETILGKYSSQESSSDSSSSDCCDDSSSEEETEKKEIIIKGQDINEYKQALKELNQSKKQQRKQQMNTVLNKSSKHSNRGPPKKGGKKAVQKQQKMYREQLKKMPLKDIQFLGKKIKFDNTKKKTEMSE